jgi:hypothetical protein
VVDGAIIVNGQKYVIPGVEVHTWHDHSMLFKPPNAPVRFVLPTWFVIHWTASERVGEAGAKLMFDNLKARGLSVEFMITNEGTIWQFFDPGEFHGRHCSRLNSKSLGVEVSGYGWAAKPGRVARGDTARRRVYEARIHGWKTEWFDFLDEQYKALFGLADAVTTALPSIPRRVERAPFGRRSDEYFATHAGFCGHFQGASFKKRHPKCDPGTKPLIDLADHFSS